MTCRNSLFRKPLADGLRPAKKKKGFTVLTLAAVMTVMLAMLGVCVDLGRMYIVKNELQAFADMAAMAAAFELDGTQYGLDRATYVATNGPTQGSYSNKFNFASAAVSGVQAEFSTASTGPWSATPGSPTGLRFVRVQAQGPVSLFFLPVLPQIGWTQPVAARALAGQGVEDKLGGGGDPFSPDAKVNDLYGTTSNFGFVQDNASTLYAIKWAPPGQRSNANGMCNGDLGSPYESGSEDRGYIDVGQGEGNSGLVDAIIDRDFFLPSPLEVGDTIDQVQGNKNIPNSMEDRFNQDTDTYSATYAQYQNNIVPNSDPPRRVGNARRLLTVPVNYHNTVIGFATFFMPLNMACFHNNVRPCCAEFVGVGAVKNGTGPGGGTAGHLYVVKLFE